MFGVLVVQAIQVQNFEGAVIDGLGLIRPWWDDNHYLGLWIDVHLFGHSADGYGVQSKQGKLAWISLVREIAFLDVKPIRLTSLHHF